MERENECGPYLMSQKSRKNCNPVIFKNKCTLQNCRKWDTLYLKGSQLVTGYRNLAHCVNKFGLGGNKECECGTSEKILDHLEREML